MVVLPDSVLMISSYKSQIQFQNDPITTAVQLALPGIESPFELWKNQSHLY